MMLYPSMSTLTKQVSNRYCLVNVVARRARQVADLQEKTDDRSEEKSVTTAIQEVAEGKFTDR